MTRLIRPNKSCQVPSQHIILDTETIPGPPQGPRQRRVHKFRLACASFFRWEDSKATRFDRQSFFNTQEIIKWIFTKVTTRRMTWIWSHGAMFDWTAIDIWTTLEERAIQLQLACLESRPNFLITSIGKAPLWLIDSCNWWGLPLSELGESLSIKKLPMPQFGESNDIWVKYCRRDVEILEAVVIDLLCWVTSNDLGCLRISAPGQAMQAWKHKFAPRVTLRLPVNHHNGSRSMQDREVCLPITHSLPEVKNLERAAYFQGTVRVNYIGEVQGPVYCLDVNSCYPSVMLDGLVPESLERWDCDDKPKSSPAEEDYKRTIAEVEILTRSPDYPLRVGTHCVYPVGRFWTCLCGPELEHANSRGRVCAFGRFAVYRLSNLFRHFIETFWQMRCDYKASGNQAKEQLCKVIMNSLAGKFGQRSHKWEKAPDNIQWGYPWGRFDIVQTNKTVKHYRSLAWLIEEQQKPGEHPESFPAVAAWVTSLARVKMLKLLEECKHAGKVYYSAIDSIHATKQAYDETVRRGRISDELGCLRVETIASRVEYRGIANYTIDGQMHVAGLPRSACLQPDGKVINTSLESRAPQMGGVRPTGIYQYTTITSITPPYLHGVVNPDGSTRPWILPLEELEMRKCLENATAIPFTNCDAPAATPNIVVGPSLSTGQ